MREYHQPCVSASPASSPSCVQPAGVVTVEAATSVKRPRTMTSLTVVDGVFTSMDMTFWTGATVVAMTNVIRGPASAASAASAASVALLTKVSAIASAGPGASFAAASVTVETAPGPESWDVGCTLHIPVESSQTAP